MRALPSRKCPALLLAAAAALALAGCSVGPDYHPPTARVPDQFSTGSIAATQPGNGVDLQRWWLSLHDENLNRLIQAAVDNNPDFEIALTNLQEAREQEAVAMGMLYPTAEASGAVARGSGNNSVNGRIAQPIYAGTNTAGLKQITQAVGFAGGWELDLFGKYRRELEAAHADAQAAAEARNAVLVSVIADVARTYVAMQTLQMRVQIAEQNLKTVRDTVNLVADRYHRGITDELDVTLARRELATLQSDEPVLQSQLLQSQRELMVLTGRFPQDLADHLDVTAILPSPPASIQPGLPIELLRRRPDIREAERELAASTARIGLATADLFPRVAITGGLGIQGQGVGVEPAASKYIWSVGPTAYWPLLDFGTLDALVEVQNIRTQRALLKYKQVVLDAVEEVDNAASNYSADQEQLAQLAIAMQQAKAAEKLAEQRYDRGLTDFLNVLDAQRQLYAIQDQYAIAQQDLLLQLILFYKALGGGWDGLAPTPPVHHPEPAVIAVFHRANAKAPTE